MEPARFFLPIPPPADAPLFLQRAGRTLLIGYREDDRWVLARGWRKGDRFTDIRCWRFDSTAGFIAQVGRLVAEEACRGEAIEATQRAEEWISTTEASRVQ